MKVRADINRRDLILFNILLLPCLRSTYITIGVLALAIFAFLFWQKGCPITMRAWIVMGVASIGGGLGGLIAGVIISFTCILLSSTKSNGILGVHEYEISSDGLLEVTSANEGLSKWSGIQDIRRIGPFLLFRISGYLFHVIPKRSFESGEKFDEFLERAQLLWKDAG